jgi:predicted GNAT family acetyltransferase
MTDDGDLRFRDDTSARRYELWRGEAVVGFVDYRTEPGVVLLDHVEVDSSLRGQGLGSRLVAHALDDIRTRGLSVVAVCPFASWYLEEHPEHGDLVTRTDAST